MTVYMRRSLAVAAIVAGLLAAMGLADWWYVLAGVAAAAALTADELEQS